MRLTLLRTLLLLLSMGHTAAFAPVAPTVHPMRRAAVPRAAPPLASAKIIPAAHTALGCSLLIRSVGAGIDCAALVLASTGLLATLNLAVTDNARYTSAKRAISRVGDEELPSAELAKQWYTAVRVQVFGQFLGLFWMAHGAWISLNPTSVLRGGAVFMAANVAFFLLGAGAAKHDNRGLPAPMKPQLVLFILTTDLVLFGGALLGALAPKASFFRAFFSCIFAAGCLIGAVEGAPKTFRAAKRRARVALLVRARGQKGSD